MPAPQSKNSPQISETLQEPLSQRVDAICPKHGAYVATVTEYRIFDNPTTVTSSCPACSAERVAAEDARKRSEAAAERNRKIAMLVSRSGIPQRFSDRSFDGYEALVSGQKVALGVCKAYADKWDEKARSGASLVLTGAPGTGKTHLACAIGNAVMAGHLSSVLFCTVSAMLRAIKATYRKDAERTEQDVISRLCDPDLLIVDEIGVQIGSEREKLLMFEILNERYQDMRPTILISNLSSSELEEFLGQRVMDRYRECGAVIAFDWQSHRGQK